MVLNKFIIILIFKTFLLISLVKTQPLVILEYSESSNVETQDDSNSENFSTYYRVKKNDTLSKIIEKFYGNKGLNISFARQLFCIKIKMFL